MWMLINFLTWLEVCRKSIAEKRHQWFEWFLDKILVFDILVFDILVFWSGLVLENILLVWSEKEKRPDRTQKDDLVSTSIDPRNKTELSESLAGLS